jgi:hypothetical protein
MSDDQQQQQRQEAHASGVVQRQRLRWGVLAALIIWTLILFVTDSGLAQQYFNANTVLYNHSGAVRNHGYALTVVFAALGFVTYVAPVIFGALARTWRGALAFALVPLWLAMLPAIATSFAGYVPGSLIFGAGPMRLAPIGAPVWLDTSRTLALVMGSAIFAILTTVGWAARHAWTHELRTLR